MPRDRHTLPDPIVLHETLEEGRRVLEMSLERFDRQFRRTERVQGLAVAMLAVTAAALGIPEVPRAGPLDVAARSLLSIALASNFVGAMLLARALGGSRRNLVSFGPDLGRLETMLDEPGWDLTGFRSAMLRVLNRDVRSNMEEERRLLFGRTQGTRFLTLSAILHLLNLIFIQGGVFFV